MKSFMGMARALALVAVGMCAGPALAQQQDLPYRAERMVPLADAVQSQLKPYTDVTNLRAARIAWGGDLATVAGDQQGIYRAAGLNVAFHTDDDLKRQVQEMLDGKLHFLRVTMGQAVQAAPAFEKAGTDLVVIAQLTWSTGGDTYVASAEIRSLGDLKGKRVVMTLYGPHPEYFAKMLTDAGVDLSTVEIVWVEKFLQSDPDSKGKFIDPLQAFQHSQSLPAGKGRIDGAMLIIPEADNVTGDEGVPGAHVLATTKDSPYIIADVYAVRGDFFDKHRDICERFVRATLKSEEWIANADHDSAEFKEVMTAGANALLSSDDPSEASVMLGDCTFALHGGNRVFFTGRTAEGKFDFRNGKTLVSEILASFSKMGLVKQRSAEGFPIRFANWDFNSLGQGLRFPDVVQGQVFNPVQTEAFVNNLVNGEAGSLDQLVSMVTRKITFEAGENSFDPTAYTDMYQELWELGRTHAGTPIAIIGYADPSTVLYVEQSGKASSQKVKDLHAKLHAQSIERAKAVLEAFIAWCESKGYLVNPGQYVATGVGGKYPRTDMKPILALITEAVAANDNAKFQRAVDMAAPNRIVEFRLQRTESAEVTTLQGLSDLMDDSKDQK